MPDGLQAQLAAAAEDIPLVADDVTLSDALQAAGVFVFSIVLAVLLRRLLVRAIDREAGRRLGRVLGRLLSVVVVAVGAVYALGGLGVRIGPLLGALGVGGVAIAFAAQDILQNFVAGVLLQIRHPFRVGDQIGSGDYEGVVEDVNLRTTELKTYDGLTVYLPNAEVLQNPIVNYTRTPLNRTSLTVGIAYDADLEEARAVLLEACGVAEGVEVSPRPKPGSKSSATPRSTWRCATGTKPTSPVGGGSVVQLPPRSSQRWTRRGLRSRFRSGRSGSLRTDLQASVVRVDAWGGSGTVAPASPGSSDAVLCRQGDKATRSGEPRFGVDGRSRGWSAPHDVSLSGSPSKAGAPRPFGIDAVLLTAALIEDGTTTRLELTDG